jgi:hypothetical protein
VFSIVGGSDAAEFTISNGNLVFVTAPNFENPSDADHNNSYIVQVAASDGVNVTNATITVNVTDVNDVAPSITTATTQSVAENSTLVAALTSTDVDTVGTNPAAFSISGGNDAAKFAVSNGNLVFVTAPNFENPSDADHNNSYVVQLSASDGVNVTKATITVNVTDVNDVAPVIATATTQSTPEHSTFVAALISTDVDTVGTNPAAFSIVGGSDAVKFTITNGNLFFVTAPNFTNPTDADHNNSYIVQVRAFDGVNGTNTTITVNVTDVNEAVSHAPVINSDGGGDTAALSVAENTTAVTTVTTTDLDGDMLTYSLVGGADQAMFQINASSGALSFITAPNFEAPADSDHNNSYVVQVRVSDGSLADTQTVTVNVSNTPDVDAIDGGAYTDLGGDHRTDVLLHNTNGAVALWQMNGGQVLAASIIGSVGTEWNVQSTADFNGDGRGDVLWRATDGRVMVWTMNGPQLQNAQIIGSVGNEWHMTGHRRPRRRRQGRLGLAQ